MLDQNLATGPIGVGCFLMTKEPSTPVLRLLPNPIPMTVITIETDNRQFVKAIVALCKALGVAKVQTSSPTPAAPKRLRKDLEATLDKIDRGDTTGTLSFTSVEEIKQHFGLPQ
jgi:hypothetical protein